MNGYSHTAFRNLKYNVRSMLIPKFSGPGYYVFMSVNFDTGLLESIAPVITVPLCGICDTS